ncbi:MAG: hypothetical protein FJX61_14980 [Alphaproteobacteria bacterium]|nr:hypothetical protein [Alphaproteobacteria bacterium]
MPGGVAAGGAAALGALGASRSLTVRRPRGSGGILSAVISTSGARRCPTRVAVPGINSRLTSRAGASVPGMLTSIGGRPLPPITIVSCAPAGSNAQSNAAAAAPASNMR